MNKFFAITLAIATVIGNVSVAEAKHRQPRHDQQWNNDIDGRHNRHERRQWRKRHAVGQQLNITIIGANEVTILNELDNSKHRPRYDEDENIETENEELPAISSARPSCVPEGWGGIFPNAKRIGQIWKAKVPANAGNGRSVEYYNHCERASCDNAGGYRCSGGMLGFE